MTDPSLSLVCARTVFPELKGAAVLVLLLLADAHSPKYFKHDDDSLPNNPRFSQLLVSLTESLHARHCILCARQRYSRARCV